jgi:hypothetical protein
MKTVSVIVGLLTLLFLVSCRTAPTADTASAPQHELAPVQLIQRIPVPDVAHRSLYGMPQTTVGVRTGIFFGTSLYVGVPAAGLEPAQVWNYVCRNRI